MPSERHSRFLTFHARPQRRSIIRQRWVPATTRIGVEGRSTIERPHRPLVVINARMLAGKLKVGNIAEA